MSITQTQKKKVSWKLAGVLLLFILTSNSHATNIISSNTTLDFEHIVLQGTVRDFSETHPDFEREDFADVGGWKPGMVQDELGEDGKPVFNEDTDPPSVESEESFNQWFNDVPDVNASAPLEIVLRRVPESSDSAPIYVFENNTFFPIDGLLFGNEGRIHNYHFTYELHTQFTYTGPQELKFVSDDDLFVYINDQLVIDLGGIHALEDQTVNTGDLGLEVGESYTLDLFFAERHTTESFLMMQTGIELQNPEPITNPVAIRSFNRQYLHAGDELEVVIEVINSGDHPQSWTVLEEMPLGWKADDVSHDGAVASNSIFWNIMAEPGTTRLTYKAISPMTLLGEPEWHGAVKEESIRGENRLHVISPAYPPFDAHLDIGNPGRTGGYFIFGNEWAVTGSGQGIGHTADHFHFLYKKLEGDFRFTIENAELSTLSDQFQANLLSRMGIMMREDLNPASPFVFFNFQNLNKHLGLQWRTTKGADAEWALDLQNLAFVNSSTRLSLQRVGDSVVASTIGPFGKETIVAVHSVPMDETVYVGVAVTSSLTGETVTGHFQNPVFEEANGDLIYAQDFEDEVEGEWSHERRDHTPEGEQEFLGPFSNDVVSLRLDDIPDHTDLLVCFDFYAIRSWDGNNDQDNLGPDIFSLYVDSPAPLLYTSVSNDHGRYQNAYHADTDGEFLQSFPLNYPHGQFKGRRGAVENNTLGYLFHEEPMDSVYRIAKIVRHSGHSSLIRFAATGLQGLDDESWGLDNVKVYALNRQVQPFHFPTPTETPIETPIETPSETPTETPVEIATTLMGTIRDFQDWHPDFEHFTGSDVDAGIVKKHLKKDRKPDFNPSSKHKTVSNRVTFDQWFTNVPGINKARQFRITLKLYPNNTRVLPTEWVDKPSSIQCIEDNPTGAVYRYSAEDFFPIDHQLWGNQGRKHNYHFTYELHAKFRYTGPAEFTVASDDDMWVFINDKLVIDLGGAHPEQCESINLGELRLKKDRYYPVDIFYAERHTSHAVFFLQTGVLLEPNYVPVYPTLAPTATPTVTPRPRPTKTPIPRPTKTPTPRPIKTPTPKPDNRFTIGGGTFSVLPGKEFIVPVRITNLPETKAITFDVTYNLSDLVWMRTFSTKGTLLQPWTSVDANEISKGRIRIGAAAFMKRAISGSGDLIYLAFKVNPNVKLNNRTTLKLDNLQDGVKRAIRKTIALQIGMKGDVNANGKITAQDAQDAFQISVGRMKPSSYQEWAAEVTKDRRITAADAQKIFEASLGRIPLSQLNAIASKKKPAPTGIIRMMAASNVLSMGTVQAKAGEEVVVPIQLDNQAPLSAFLIDLTYDNNKLDYVGLELDNTLVSDFGIVDSFESSPGTIRVAAAAFLADPIVSSGVLVHLRFQVISSVPGSADISFESTDDDLADAVTYDGKVNIQSGISVAPTPYVDEIIIAQGEGGSTLVNIRNMDEKVRALTAVLRAFSGAGKAFRSKIGGGEGRATYISTGDVDGDGDPDVVITFGPVMSNAQFPNIVVVRDAKTRRVIGHSFMAFPTGDSSPVHYNGGEIRTAVGNFLHNGMNQVAVAQGRGGHAIVRLYQYTGLPAPNAFEAVGQFNGLAGGAKNGNADGGITLAAGDLDGDGVDELVVGQTASATSRTLFHYLDISAGGVVERRLGFVAFPRKFQGNGGIELAVADLNGDGLQEIIAAGQGNARDFGDSRDSTPLNLISVIKPIVQQNQVTGFVRLTNGIRNTWDENSNPSGAISIAAAELDGDPTNGKELIVGTGVIKRGNGWLRNAPQSKYLILKVHHDGSQVTQVTVPVGSVRGFKAFLGNSNPSTGAIFVGALNSDQ